MLVVAVAAAVLEAKDQGCLVIIVVLVAQWEVVSVVAAVVVK